MAAETIVSADSHVFEAVNLWQSRLERKYRERGPKFVPDYQGKAGTWFICDGAVPRSVASIAAVGIPKEELVKFSTPHYQDLRSGGYDPAARLKDQDTDGVAAEVLYATYAMGLYLLRNAELQEAVFNAYNDWMVELVSHAPDRLVGLAPISVYNVDHAVKELERWAKRGLRGAIIAAVPPEGTKYSHALYDPFWSAAEAMGLPISIHTPTSNRDSNFRFPRGTAPGYPESPIEHDFAGVPAADRVKMTCTNAAKLYGFKLNGG